MTNEQRKEAESRLLSALPKEDLEDYISRFSEYKVTSQEGDVVVIDVGNLNPAIRRVKATLDDLQEALQTHSS